MHCRYFYHLDLSGDIQNKLVAINRELRLNTASQEGREQKMVRLDWRKRKAHGELPEVLTPSRDQRRYKGKHLAGSWKHVTKQITKL